MINTNAISFISNSADVSSGLAMSDPAGNLTVTFDGLTSNSLRRAHRAWPISRAGSARNEFTFDTFDEKLPRIRRPSK